MDLKGFFDNLDKEHLMEMAGRRIADPRILRLIRKWLNAGIVEEGKWFGTEKGTPQGSVISPLLANICLHYVLDQWTDQWRQSARGDVIIVRYADDAVIGFQNQYEAPGSSGASPRRTGRNVGKGSRSRSPFRDSNMYVRRTVWGNSKSGALRMATENGASAFHALPAAA